MIKSPFPFLTNVAPNGSTHPRGQSDRGEEAAGGGIVVAVAIVVQPCFGVLALVDVGIVGIRTIVLTQKTLSRLMRRPSSALVCRGIKFAESCFL